MMKEGGWRERLLFVSPEDDTKRSDRKAQTQGRVKSDSFI
jgi:hypothetical protein